MTDIPTTAPIPLRRLRLPRLSFARPAFGTSFPMVAILLGAAFKLGYVDPYAGRRQTRVAPDNDIGGRDPDW